MTLSLQTVYNFTIQRHYDLNAVDQADVILGTYLLTYEIPVSIHGYSSGFGLIFYLFFACFYLCFCTCSYYSFGMWREVDHVDRKLLFLPLYQPDETYTVFIVMKTHVHVYSRW